MQRPRRRVDAGLASQDARPLRLIMGRGGERFVARDPASHRCRFGIAKMSGTLAANIECSRYVRFSFLECCA